MQLSCKITNGIYLNEMRLKFWRHFLPIALAVTMVNLLWALSVLQAIISSGCLPQQIPTLHLAERHTKDPGKPLFLTPYIEKGDIAEARALARVTLNASLQIDSYAGFFTVNKDYDSNQFFWYFPSMSPDKDKAPVLVWLQGGPGSSSLFGLFTENGPITVKNKQFVRRKYHWALNHHVIYIDNPVGAGFSFTRNDEGYCTNETQVGTELYSTLTQFFQLFPELQQNEFFITGESYAGKYVPALAHTILKNNSTAKTKINLKGLVIGGAWINPDSQQHFIPIHTKNESVKTGEIWTVHTAEKFIANYRHDTDDDYIALLADNAVRKAIHVGNLTYEDLSQKVYDYMSKDFWQSMAPWLSELLDYYPVVLYGGQNDNTVPYAGIVDFLRNHFNWTGAEEYRNAKRYSWRVGGELAGCVRRARLLTEIYVLGATHFVPRDQPERSLDMITRITHGKGFDQKETCSIA